MNRKLFSIGFICLIALFFIPYFAHAQEKITGPWLWMIAPTEPGQGGAASIDIDSLAVASNGAVTEADVAANGAREGDKVGNYAWTLGQISTTGAFNIKECLNRIRLIHGYVNDHTSYALFTFKSDTANTYVPMRVGGSDAIKVWFNGEVVHNPPVNGYATDFQVTFPIKLEAGDNLLMVKVSQHSFAWNMFVGIDTVSSYVGIETVSGVSSDDGQIQDPDILRPIVYVVYRPLPGSPPRPNVDAEIDALIKKTQRFFANEMERHGFGRKTFQIEVDTSGNTVVHRTPIRRSGTGVFDYTGFFDYEGFFVYMEEGHQIQGACGLGGAIDGEGGEANIYCWSWGTIAHELGHAFGLQHDFRAGSDNYIMSYGSKINPQLSHCAAEWLDVHSAFNPGRSTQNKHTKIEMLPPTLDSPPNAIRLRFKVTDPDGLHQVQLLTPTVTPGLAYGALELLSYKVLNGSTNTTIEFVTTDLTPTNKSVSLMASDVNGNFTWNIEKLPINFTSLVPPPKVVSIPDPYLSAAVQREIGNATTTHTMLYLRGLDARNSGITDLTGLEHAHNLRRLNLGTEYIEGKSVNSISDISALSELINLNELWLGGNNISDISALSALKNLNELWLGINNISDISALSGLTNLNSLRLHNNNISNISALSTLKNLNSLWLYNNNISDVFALQDMTQLTRLELHNNNISDVSALQGMTQLTQLLLFNNNISDVSALQGMTQLTQLLLFNNNISDVSALQGMTQLTRLELHNNNISDISALSTLKNLTSVYLNNNNISDISALSTLKNLNSLGLHNNNISDISALSTLKNLNSLWLYNNNISDISPLLALNLTGAEWDRTGLYLQNNPLSYTSINTHIPALQAKGFEVKYDQRTPTKLLKISGDTQQAVTNSELPLPFVVQVQDQWGRAFAEVPVTFTITDGDGYLNSTKTKTDTNGSAQTRLTFGETGGTTTVQVTVPNITHTIQFNATAVSPDAHVSLPDDNLYAKIVETLGKPTNTSITVADMLTLTSLTANNANVSNLTGLEYATNLTSLRLDRNNLSTIDSLTGLTQLTTLSLDNNKLSNIAPLVELAQLETLSLENNKLSDVTSLVKLTELKTLRLRGNLLSYPSLYTTIPTMRSSGVNVVVDTRTPTTLINIPGTPGVTGTARQVIVQVQDQNGVAFAGVPVNFALTAADGHLSTSEMTSNLNGKAITTLKLGPKPGENVVSATVTEIQQPLTFTITTIDANTLVHIPDVNLRAKIVETLNKPKNAKLNAGDLLELTRLDARNANIQDLTGLEHAHNLTSLNLSGEYIQGEGTVNSNTISEFLPVTGLTQLTRLNLSRCGLSDASFVSDLTQLTLLDLGHNTISDISPLANLIQLNQLYLSNNTISDVSSLANLIQLNQLYLSNNTISDVSSLAKLTQLTDLLLGSNSISDISPLAKLTQLTLLAVNNNTISDISPLAKLTQLNRLWLWNNIISDVSPIVGLNLTGTSWDSTGLHIRANPLSYTSINTYIPAMQAKGIEVEYNQRTPTKLLKISGDAQQAVTNSELPLPFVVQVQDQWNRAFAEVPVTFTITDGEGKLSTTKTKTNTKGSAQTRLTFGETGGTTTVQVTVPNITQSIQFSATAVSLDLPVSVPDGDLHAKIVETLGKPSGVILTLADMLTLTSLTANNTNISDLTGLQHASNLTTLMLDGNNLSTIDLLTGLTQLTTLSLDNNNLSNIAPLVELAQLETLSLENNNLSDIASLVELTELQTLRLRGNLLSYPSLYTTIPTLRSSGVNVLVDTRTPTTLINIPGTPGVAGTARQFLVEVQDQNGIAFAGVPVTFTLTAADGHLSTSEVTSNLNGKAITTLTLGPEPGENVVNATVTEIQQPLTFTLTTIDGSTLVHIPDMNLHAKIAETLNKPKNATLNAGDLLALTRLDAPNANIQVLTGIEYAYNLRHLNLGKGYIEGKGFVNSNAVSDLQPLSGLINLHTLYLHSSNISEIFALSTLTNLKTLRLQDNNISDISALSTLTNLTSLDLSRNNISVISALSTLTNLTSLLFSSNNISVISALSTLTNLHTLWLYNNNISDIVALSTLTNLTRLYLHNNNISDISALLALNLTGTEWDSTGLSLRNNPLSYTSVRTHIPALQARGIVVSFDNITHPEFLIISGDKQEELVGRTLPSPFVVEYRDANGKPKEGVNVTFSIADGDAELTDTTFTTDADGRAQTFLQLGMKLGTITVRATAESINTQLTFTASVVLPENHVPEDVNADGVVDAEDLALVAAFIDTTPLEGEGTYPNPDVNGDGVVNSDDLTLVMAALETTPTAPAAVLTAENLQRWIDEAKQLSNKSETFQRGIEVLERLLSTLLPKKTALFANFPNPFNPETWIPYHLAKPTEVTVHIYAVNGTLIRILALGHKPAGIYEHRNRAAYWDGKNAQGERVASGIYFYTLTTGNFTATRKMLIRK